MLAWEIALMCVGIYILTFAVLGSIYAGFHYKLFPRWICKIIGRAAFWPTLPMFYMNIYRKQKDLYHELVPGSNVYIGGCLMFWHVESIKKRGIKAIINLMDEFEGPTKTYMDHNITQLYLPCVDHFEPSLDQLSKAVEFIQYHKSRANGVYIHCKSGIGRSGAVAFCWLLAEKKMSLEDTQNYLLSIRKCKKTLYKQPNCISFYNKLVQNKQN